MRRTGLETLGYATGVLSPVESASDAQSTTDESEGNAWTRQAVNRVVLFPCGVTARLTVGGTSSAQ